MIYSHSRQPIAPKIPRWILSDLNRYLHKKICCMCLLMEQYMRFELMTLPWQGRMLPLHQYCISGQPHNFIEPRPLGRKMYTSFLVSYSIRLSDSKNKFATLFFEVNGIPDRTRTYIGRIRNPLPLL